MFQAEHRPSSPFRSRPANPRQRGGEMDQAARVASEGPAPRHAYDTYSPEGSRQTMRAGRHPPAPVCCAASAPGLYASSDGLLLLARCYRSGMELSYGIVSGPTRKPGWVSTAVARFTRQTGYESTGPALTDPASSEVSSVALATPARATSAALVLRGDHEPFAGARRRPGPSRAGRSSRGRGRRHGTIPARGRSTVNPAPASGSCRSAHAGRGPARRRHPKSPRQRGPSKCSS